MYVLGYAVLITVPFLPIIELFITLNKIWILFLFVVETLDIVYGGRSGLISPISSALLQIVMNLIWECEVHKCNVSTKIWRSYLQSFTMNPNSIVSHQ